MRDDLMGLELDSAVAVLAGEGIVPQVTQTDAPKRRSETGGALRVVYASDDGARLTAARFFDPIADAQQENNSH